jgi:Tfp pilus assembly pilus retraction ATPase PilT
MSNSIINKSNKSIIDANSSYNISTDVEEKRLSNLEFTDLFFSEQGESFMRGLEGAEVALDSVPESVLSDLEEMYSKVCQRGQKESEFFFDYDGIRFRVSKITDVENTWYAMRKSKWPVPRFNSLDGINKNVLMYCGALGRPKSHGLILISGPTGSGKTTTASSLLQEYLIHFGGIAVTLEDPIELFLNGSHGENDHGHCFQLAIKNGNFSSAMKQTMRYVPRYIMIGEVRSSHEASQAIHAAANGHVVITTIHAGSVTESIEAMLQFVSGSENMELARSILSNGLAGCMNQRLVKIKGKKEPSIKMEFLFPGKEKNIRALIREGKVEQLGTSIEQQANRVRNGNLPTDVD